VSLAVLYSRFRKREFRFFEKVAYATEIDLRTEELLLGFLELDNRFIKPLL
jgi:hypothetical protein